LPSFDDEIDKATTDMVVHFDKDYRVLSNGDLLEEKLDKDKKTKTWHYKLDKPYSSYLIMLGIGKYDVHTVKSKGGVVINEWYYPEHPETLEPTYRYTEDMMDFLEKETVLNTLGPPTLLYPCRTLCMVPWKT
jgi:aminopeptidase N